MSKLVGPLPPALRLPALGALHRDVKILALSMFLWEIGLTLYDPILPIHLRELGAEPGEVGVVFAAAYLVMALTSLPGGWLADRFERRRIMVLFWWLGAPSVLVLAVAQVWWQAIPGLILYYLSFTAFPAVNAYLTHAADPQRLATAFGLLYVTFPAAQLLGPTLGGLLADWAGMQVLFLVSFGFYLMSALVIMCLTPQGVSRAQVDAANRQSNIRLVTGNHSFRRFLPIGFALYLFLTLMLRFTSPFLAEVRELSLPIIGLFSSLTALGGVLLMPLFSRLADHHERRKVLGLSTGLVVLSMGLIAGSAALPILVLAFLLQGGMIVSRSLMDSVVGQFARSGQTGLSFGIFGLATGLSQATAPMIGGWLYARNPQHAFWINGVFGLILMGLLIFERRFNAK